MNKKVKKFFGNKKAAPNTLKALNNDLILQALEKNHIVFNDLYNISSYAIEALSFPSIRKCFLKKMNGCNIFYKQFDLQDVLKITSHKEMLTLLSKAQKIIKKSPFSLFAVPAGLHDEIHLVKKQLFCF